jgi:hypothetical protein
MARTKLLANQGELKAALSSLTGDLTTDSIASFLQDADLFFIGPVIGSPLFKVLLAAATYSVEQATVLRLLQRAAANHAIWQYAASGSVLIGNSGITVVKDANRLPASDKKILQLRRQCRRDAYASLEAAVSYLEQPENAAAFPEYYASSAHRQNRRFFANSSTEFSQGYDLQGNALVFSQLKQVLQTIEENCIEPLLGETLTGQLRAAVLAGNLTDLQQQLLMRILRALGPLAIAEAIPYRLVQLDEDGLVTETTKGNAENVEVTLEGSMQSTQLFMNRCQARGESELAKLTNWLNKNQSQLPGYQVKDPEALSKINDKNLGVYFL